MKKMEGGDCRCSCCLSLPFVEVVNVEEERKNECVQRGWLYEK